MAEESGQGNAPAPPQAEPDVAVLIKRMQQQLVFLEKKIDILIDQSSRRPFSEKHFSRHSRSFGRPHRPFEKRPGDSREGDFGQDRHFARHNDDRKEGFDHKKKPFAYKRKGRR